MSDNKPVVIANPWQQLRQFTDARIALGRSGASLPTGPHLAFQLAHAQARDAVHLALDGPALQQSLQTHGVPGASACLHLHSAAEDRLTYLQRPDLGRRLSDASRQLLQALRRDAPAGADAGGDAFDIAFVLADGLSALAVARHAAPLMAAITRKIAPENWTTAPVCIASQARVALGDEIGAALQARLVVILIGERPGLSSPDSLGAYLTWMPRVGLTDASRNCISNIRPAGLGYEDAAIKLHYLASQMHLRQLSGVGLKDQSSNQALQIK